MSGHLSSDEIAAWILGERTPETRRHVTECGLCGAEVGRLENAFQQFRDSGERWSRHWFTSETVRRPEPVPLWRRLAASGGLVAAALAIVLLVHTPAAPRADEGPFLAIPYAGPLAPYEQATVMRMEVPVTALIAAGIEVHAAELGSVLTMDVLVGQDGRAHAFRPINRSERQ